jgi:hypothetical protein
MLVSNNATVNDRYHIPSSCHFFLLFASGPSSSITLSRLIWNSSSESATSSYVVIGAIFPPFEEPHPFSSSATAVRVEVFLFFAIVIVVRFMCCGKIESSAKSQKILVILAPRLGKTASESLAYQFAPLFLD